MITWLQTRFQGGYKIIFLLLLVVVIVAFVFTIGQAPGMGRGGDRGEPMEYFGYDLRSQSDRDELFRLASISFYVNNGREPGQQLQQYALSRLAYLNAGRDLGLPTPTDRELQQFISSLDAFRTPNGSFDPASYQEYLDSVEANPRIGINDMIRVFEEDFIVEKVRELLGGPGYALPHDVKRQVARRNTEWTIELASLPLEDLDVEVEPEEEDLVAFYEENEFRYEVAPRKSISYVVFETDRYLDRVEEPSESEMLDYFEQNRDDFSLPPEEEEELREAAEAEGTGGDGEDGGAEGEDSSMPWEVSLEDVEDEVAAILKERAARRLAREAASDFTFSLFEDDVGMNSEALEEKIAEADVPNRSLEPFPEGERPAEVDFPDPLIRDIRRLDEDRFYSDPYEFDGDIVVALLEEVIPAFVPPFEEVRDQVAADYREEERRRLRSERGNELYETLSEQVENEVPFPEAAEDQGMEVSEFDPFTLQSPPEDLPQTVRTQLGELRAGEVSRMIQAENRAYFVHVVAREVPSITEDHEDYVSSRAQTKNFSSTISEQLAVQDIQSRAMPRTTQSAQQ